MIDNNGNLLTWIQFDLCSNGMFNCVKTIVDEKVWSFFTKQPHNKINFKIMTKDWVTQLD